jgi:energy-coupling factor transport system ATP-binding protein
MSEVRDLVGSAPVVDVRDAFCLHALPEGAVVALRGITLTVAAGERVVVHGPNGSGKTTLLRLLAGEQTLAAGRAVVAGRAVGEGTGGRGAWTSSIGRAAARWRAEKLGWVDQHPERTLRPELDVLDNVALQQRLAGIPVTAARVAAHEALDSVGVGHLAGRGIGTLSGGEAQRVAVAAAIAHKPTLVLADEPSGELDAANAELVYDALATAASAAGAALVLVSHDRRAARVADRVVRIRDGRLSETWEPGGEELLVVDDRGWLRLPEPMRPPFGAVRAVPDRDAILLEPTGAPVEPPASASGPVPAAAMPAPGAVAGAGAGPVASLKGVTKSYRDQVVLAGLDLVVDGGALTVVRGRSGAGKSTLLRILVGLELPDAGRVELAGLDLAGLDRAALARLRRDHAAVVGQSVHLAETSDALTNLDIARAVRGLPADPQGDLRWLEALDLAALRHRAVRLLSGGERQRVAVARALAVGARLILLDEPSSQLDEASVERLAVVLVAAARAGTGVVVASHDPVLVDAADVVVDLEHP